MPSYHSSIPSYPSSESDSLPMSLEEKLALLADKTDLIYEKDVEASEYYKLGFPPSSRVPTWDSLKSSAPAFSVLSLVKNSLKLTSAILPSFVLSRLNGETGKPARLTPTSHLDGMRGLAAFFVFLCHLSYNCYVITSGFGQGEPGENNNILQLPIIRLFYSGPPMVTIFFVISGYALSIKPLRQARSQQWDSLLTTLTSSTFRRGMRLFIPTTISTFMIMIFLQLGWYEGTRSFATNKIFMRNVPEPHPPRLETFELQFWHWCWKVFQFIHVFSWGNFDGSTPYDVHLWTIPVEFRASLALFLVILGLAKTKSGTRLAMLVGVMCFTLRNDRWETVLFMCGAFLAELDLIRGPLSSTSPTSSSDSPSLGPQPDPVSQKRVFLSTLVRFAWVVVGIIALYLMSQPDILFELTPGWVYLSSLIPEWFSAKYRFWQCVGSVMFVWAVNNSLLLQKPFNHPFVQYFGRIAYALYLVHGPVIHIIGFRVEAMAWELTGWSTPMRYNLGFILASMVIIPLTVWVADLFWRAIDIPSVKFARWMERKCSVSSD